MQFWGRKKGMMGDDPPYLTVGTEVSAKYKGAFCEAKVRKVVRSVKCKVTFKLGLGTAIITDDQIRGTLRVGAICEVKHPEKKEYVEATINKIQDCSQYTVVFDDGDITTLRRTALCLKSGRHFAESETLDQLPLTHPEHFGNPVIGGRKGRRSRQTHEDSSDDEGTQKKGKKKEEKEADIGKVVCVELGDKKKQKDNWFPGLVVAPTAQDTVRIRVKDEYLVRSFKDGRYFTVPKKEATEFTREIGAKVDNNTLRTAVEKALMYLDKDELPPHWDRDLLFGMDESSGNSDSDGGFDSDSSDDEPREEKDHFVAQLYKFMDDRGTPINKGPVIGSRDVDLYKLFKVVHKLGGYNRVTNQNQWKIISHKLGFGQGSSSIVNLVKQAYKKFLHSFEDFYRKLGCTMVNHPRGNRSRHRSGRSLIRDRDRATPIHTIKEKEKARSQSNEKARSQSNEKAGAQSSEKSGETASKSTPQHDKKEAEKSTEEKEKPEDPPKAKEQKKEKTKAKDEKAETSNKEDKKTERNKIKDDDTPADKSKKEEKSKTVEAKEEVEEKEDRLRTRETRKDDKVKESRSKAAASSSSQNTSAVTSESESANKASETKAPEEHTKTRLQREITPSPVVASEPSCSDEKVKSKDEKVKLKEPKQKAKDLKSKKEEKAKSTERSKAKEEKTEVKVKEEKPKEEKQKEEKVKEEKAKEEKIKEEKVAVEEVKPEESKKKVEKKVEDEEKQTQQTRSKSKDDMRQKKDTVTPERRSSDSRTPSRDSEKRIPLRPKKSEEEPVVIAKKRGRKRKDTDEKNKGEENMGQLASNITVGVGDKLKVYYGPTHESKVTYEAKVIEISMEDNETVYRVHYTGWNTRYDEWIKRGRIADNLSWTPSRAKRLRHQQAQAQLKASKPPGKRGRPSLASKAQELPNMQQSQPPRSTTPSSVTSSSSRTKSPATSRTGSTGGRVTRNTSESSNILSPDFRRRTRRMSGHTDDISIASESESEDFESESEVEPTQTRSKTEKKSLPLEKEDTKDESLKIDVKKLEKPFRRKTSKRKDEEEEDKVSIKEEENNDLSPEPDGIEPQEKRRSKRTKKSPATSPEKKDEDIKEEIAVKQDLGADCEEEQPKGRDFDLNQIRSELKGIEKAVKLPQDILHRPDETNSQVVIDEKPESEDKEQEEEEEEEEEIESKEDEKQPEKQEETSTEDIYEFKEPEPFELEVRSKRDSLLSEERGSKLNRRSRFFDDVIESKADKPPRKKLVRSVTPVTKVEGKEDSPFEGELRRRFRRTPTKKTENILEPKKKESGSGEISVSPIKPLYAEPVTPQKVRPLSACEEAFDKLCESPSYQVASKSSEGNSPSPKTVKSPELELSLFSELPGEGGDDDVEDDSEDRLVISETDETETETEEPLFTYSQRHHEEIFPTLVGSESSAPTVPEITNSLEQITPSKTSPDPPRLLPMAPDIFTAFSTRTEATTKVEELQKPATSDETDKIVEEPSKSAGSVDVMKLLMKGDDDDFEDDPINAAIQRVIEQSMTDEESNDMDIFGTKQTVCSIADLQPEPVTPQEESLPPEVPRKETPSKEIKRKSGGRKPVLSKEFVEDSDSDTDSSDEGERLVIAKVDDDDDASSSSSQSSLKLHVSESSDTEMKLRLSDKDEDSKVEEDDDEKENKDEDMPLPAPADKVEVTQNVSEEETLVKSEPKVTEEETTATSKPEEEQDEEEEEAEEEETNKEEAEQFVSVTKTEEIEVKEETIAEVEKVEIKEPEEEEVVKAVPDSSDSEMKDCIIEPKVEEMEEEEEEEKKGKDVDDVLPLEKPEEVQEKSSEEVKCEDEVENNVQSLLCEETIPGSPTPVTDPMQSSEMCQEEPEDTKVAVLEMPFASAPGNNCSAATSSSTSPGKITPIFASAPLAESSVPVKVELPAPMEADHIVPSSQEASVPLPVVVAGPGPAAVAAAIVVQGPSPSIPKRNSNEAAPVMDNTPPTTPDSSLSTISGSPREERDGMSPTMDNESSKSHRDSFEIDLDSCAEGNKVDHYSEEDSLLNIEVSNSSDNRMQGLKLLPKKQDADKEAEASPKKRRRSRKRSECESNKRSRHSSGKAIRTIGGNGNGGAGSDSDDTSENSTAGACTPLASTENVLSSRSPRPSKYNFYVELDPELDGTQRIALLQQKLQELRKTYMNVKAELACIDRRRKKLRRREREGEIPRIMKN